MAGDDTQGSGPDLELPSLFRRRAKNREKRARGDADAGAAPAGDSARTEVTPATEELAPTSRPVAGDEPTQPLRPVPGAARRPPSAPPPTTSAPTTSAPRPEADPTPQPGPGAEVDEPPARPPKPTGPPPRPRRRGPDMTWSDGGARPSSPSSPSAAAGPVALVDDHAEEPAGGPTGGLATEPDRDAGAPRRFSRPSLPSVSLAVPELSPRLAARVTGVVVAVTGILLVWLSLQACSSVRGVSSCGGVGLLAIVLTLVAQGAVGTVLLGLLGVASARSTAVLGIGVASFVAMVLLYASLPGPWLSVALLVVTPAAFLLAEGVTSGRFADTS